MIKVVACIVIGIIVIFTLSCCKAAKEADEHMGNYND